jgi:hypothetical protein
VLCGSASADSDVDLLVQFVSGAKTFDRFVGILDPGEPIWGRLGVTPRTNLDPRNARSPHARGRTSRTRARAHCTR